MIEQHRRTLLFPVQDDLSTLQQRVNDRHDRYKRSYRSVGGVHEMASLLLASSARLFAHLPSRYFLHLVIALIIPVSLGLSQLAFLGPMTISEVQSPLVADAPIGLGPLSLDESASANQQRIGDPPLAAHDALPMPLSLTSRSEALAPLIVPATIAGETVRLRNGPGLEYDDVRRMDGGTSVQVIGRFGDWFQVRQGEDQELYWVAGEMLTIPQAAIYNLFEVDQSDIPTPPPPRIAMVREEGLRLRDGPGTNYVKIRSLEVGQTLSLVEQYQDWLHVATDDFDGWVNEEFLDIGVGIMQRVPKTATIPDPNPALIGTVNDNMVNMREGPGKVYGKIDTIDAGHQIDLLARYKDWYNVQLGDGQKAWIFSELLDVAPMVQRRVPQTNDIPAPPAGIGGGGGGAAGLPASGDVAGFAMQFVGYGYVYGGSSPGSGFDCSGLTNYVYRQFGVSLPRQAAAQYSTAHGTMVGSINNLAPGDLVFFVNTGGGRGITHVAIYVGGGRIVHAMMPGLGVQVSSIYESYWSSHYYGGLRVHR